VFTVSARAAPEYAVGPVVLSLPCVIGSSGVERQPLLAMSEEERRTLRRSAEMLEAAYHSLAPAARARWRRTESEA
jgi:L-lactate dehydrogenase